MTQWSDSNVPQSLRSVRS